jgi:hypothetical protein
MNQTKRQARLAGLLYFLASVPAPFGLIYVPNKLIVLNDATATANHIRASESLLRLGIGCELLSSIMFIFVVVALYRLFKAVNETHALLMMILILVSIPISLLSVVNEIVALVVVSGANFLSAFDTGQLDALAYILMRLHSRANASLADAYVANIRNKSVSNPPRSLAASVRVSAMGPFWPGRSGVSSIRSLPPKPSLLYRNLLGGLFPIH